MLKREVNHNLQKQSTNRTIGLGTTLTFGKYAGFTVMEVIKRNSQYVDWMVNNMPSYTFSPKIAATLKKIVS
jgi:hypothetical protein